MKARVNLFLPSVNFLEEQAAGVCKCMPVIVYCPVIPFWNQMMPFFIFWKEHHKRSRQKQLPHINLCSFMKLIKRKSGEQADYLCIVYSMGYKFCFLLFFFFKLPLHKLLALQHPYWLSCPPQNVSIFITAQGVCQVFLNVQGF